MGDAMVSRARLALILAALCASSLASAAGGQPNKVHKTTLQEQQFPPPLYHTVTMKAVVDPGGEVTRHTHPGAEMAYIVEGQAVVRVNGQPDRSLSAGDSFTIPPRIVHSVQNKGSGALVIVSTYVVEKGQPIASPAP